MKKLLLVTSIAIALTATSAMAHDNDKGFSLSSGDHCDLDFSNSLRLDKNAIEITNSDNQMLRIDNDSTVTVDGEKLSLSNEQTQAVTDYANGLREHLPKVADIALEGIKLAGVALDEVSATFNIGGLDDIGALMEEVATEVHAGFYDGGDFVFDQKNFDKIEQNFGPAFESRIEQAIEENMVESIGSILVAVGSEMLTSGGDMSAVEQKFENMGQRIEQAMEGKAADIEAKADALCGSFLQLAQQENELQHLIPGIEDYDLFVVKTK